MWQIVNNLELIAETLPSQDTPIPNAKEIHLYEYDFDDLTLTEDDTLRATVRMFLDSGVTAKFQVPLEVK